MVGNLLVHFLHYCTRRWVLHDPEVDMHFTLRPAQEQYSNCHLYPVLFLSSAVALNTSRGLNIEDLGMKISKTWVLPQTGDYKINGNRKKRIHYW